MSENNKKMTIWSDSNTIDKLKALRLVPEEYLNSVINRLIKEHEENKE